MTALEIRLILYGILFLGILGGVLYWNSHERNIGATGCRQDDLNSANRQLEQQKKDLANYQKQLGEANDRHEEDQRLLAAAAASSLPHLLCHQTSAKSVPALPGTAQGPGSASGIAGNVREPDFDPSPALRRLSVGYERRVRPYIDAVNKWPKE